MVRPAGGARRAEAVPAAQQAAVPRQALPGSGETLPQVQPTAAGQVATAQTAGRITEYVQSLRRDLQFRVDEATDKVVVTVVDPESGEVVRQIPSEEVIAVARALGQSQGLLVDTKA
jgi:flagellar protein FlaG